MRICSIGALCAIALGAGATQTLAADVNLRFYTIFDATGVELWEPILAEYEKANPNVDVVLETVAGSGAAIYPDVLRTAMASGDPPDVFFMWGGETAGPFIDAKQTMDLAKYFTEYGWDKVVAPWTVERIKRNGALYGVPARARGMGLWYRKDIFDQHGLAEPKTYAELEAICTKLKENNIYCASVGGKFGWHLMRFVDYFLESTCGPAMHDQINSLSASWDQPCVVEAYQRLKKWVDNEWLVPDFLTVSPDDARMPMYLGNAAMVLEGDWFEGVANSDGQDIANYVFFLPPTDQEPLRYSAFPEQWMIAANAKNPDEAAKFINWITLPENQKMFPDAFTNSATVGVQPDCEKFPRNCQWREIVLSDRQTYPPTDQAFTKELMDSFFEIQDGIVSGKFTPEAGAATMQERAEAWKAAKK